MPDAIENFILEMREYDEMIEFVAVCKVNMQTHNGLIERIVAIDRSADDSRRGGMSSDFSRCMRDHPTLQDRWGTLVHDSVKWKGKIDALTACARSVSILTTQTSAAHSFSTLENAYTTFEANVGSLPAGICDDVGDTFGKKLEDCARSWLDSKSAHRLTTSTDLDRLQTLLQKALQVSPLQQQLDAFVQTVALRLQSLGSAEKSRGVRDHLDKVKKVAECSSEDLQAMQTELKKHPNLHTFEEDLLGAIQQTANDLVDHVQYEVHSLTAWMDDSHSAQAFAKLDLASKLFTASTDPKKVLKTSQPGLTKCIAVKSVCNLLSVHDRVKPQNDQTIADVAKLDLVSLSKLTDISRSYKKCLADLRMYRSQPPAAAEDQPTEIADPAIVALAAETATELSSLSYSSWMEMSQPEAEALNTLALTTGAPDDKSDSPWWVEFDGGWRDLVSKAECLLKISRESLVDQVAKVVQFETKLNMLQSLMVGSHDNKAGRAMVTNSLHFGRIALGLHRLVTAYEDAEGTAKNRRTITREVVATFKEYKVPVVDMPAVLQANIKLAMKGDKLNID